MATETKDIESKPSAGERLKAEGNAFHGQGNHQAA
jgi:hypothetical protein